MNLLRQYEHNLNQRVEAGEITASSRETYMNDAAKVVEALVALIPVRVIEAYVRTWGAKGDYGTAIRRLVAIATEEE